MSLPRLAVRILLVIAVIAAAIAVQQLPFWWGTRAPEEEARRLIPIAGIAPGSVVAEIGAGAGPMAKVVAPALLPGGRMYLTDIGDAELATLQALTSTHGWTHVEVRRGDVAGTALPDACCDVIYMRHVFHHFEDAPSMARAVRRALKTGGRLIVIDFLPNRLLGLIAPLAHNAGSHGMTPPDVARIVNAAGFTLVRDDRDWTSGSFLLMWRAE